MTAIITPFGDMVTDITPEDSAAARRRALAVAHCYCLAVLPNGERTCGGNECERFDAMDRKGLVP